MSRGFGRVQRGILDVIEREELRDDGLPHWVSIEDLSLHIYETDKPTPSQRESIRRAAHKLAEVGQVEVRRSSVGYDEWSDKARTRSVTHPAGTPFYCEKANWGDDFDCEGCEKGLPVEDWNDKPGEATKWGHWRRFHHVWPEERTFTWQEGWGTSALLIRAALNDEQRTIEDQQRAEMKARIKAWVGR